MAVPYVKKEVKLPAARYLCQGPVEANMAHNQKENIKSQIERYSILYNQRSSTLNVSRSLLNPLAFGYFVIMVLGRI